MYKPAKLMKIFQVITVSEYGGAQSIVANLVKALSPEHKVFILYGGEGEAWSSLGDNFTRIRLNRHRKGIGIADIWLLIKLFYYRLKYNPDIIHLHSSKMGVLGRIAFSKKKIVLTMHGFDSVRKNHTNFLAVEQLLKSRAAVIAGVSQYDMHAMIGEGIVQNVTYIYNGVPDYYALTPQYNVRLKEDLDSIRSRYPHLVMCVARISEQKRFDLFLEIALRIPDKAFVWIGNKEKIEHLPPNVYCLGEVDSAHVYLKFADLFILPSNYEGLPMSLLEAMSFAKPIVASAVGGITEVLNKGNGFAVENEIDIFVDKINYILSDEEVYKAMSKKSREIYLQHHTIDKMVESYLDMYKTLVKKQK